MLKYFTKIKKEFPEYENFLTNYFEKHFKPYILDKSLDYQSLPSNCRTNNFLENYNGYIKIQLGKNRYINLVNFIHFIKTQNHKILSKKSNFINRMMKKIGWK